jgi:hypothetical protein
MVTIYMPLVKEETDVWRPVEATPLPNDLYRVEGPMRDDEAWAFPPGAVVRCEPKRFHEGDGLTAISLGG